jgi:hypothetical protein
MVTFGEHVGGFGFPNALKMTSLKPEAVCDFAFNVRLASIACYPAVGEFQPQQNNAIKFRLSTKISFIDDGNI